jgi:acetyltransferase-like isoleucine patch superfamily enzyme
MNKSNTSASGLASWLKSVRRFRRKNPLLMKGRPEYADYDIGDWTYGIPVIVKWDEATRLHVGKFCSIAEGVRILLGGEHHPDWVTTYPLDIFLPLNQQTAASRQTKGDIRIGNDVWIGAGVIILSGVTVGDGAVIGAGSVVCRDIPPYAIAAGNPVRTIRYRFEEPVIQALLQIKWWDWPIEKIVQCAPSLMSADLRDFVKKHGQSGLAPSSL